MLKTQAQARPSCEAGVSACASRQAGSGGLWFVQTVRLLTIEPERLRPWRSARSGNNFWQPLLTSRPRSVLMANTAESRSGIELIFRIPAQNVRSAILHGGKTGRGPVLRERRRRCRVGYIYSGCQKSSPKAGVPLGNGCNFSRLNQALTFTAAAQGGEDAETTEERDRARGFGNHDEVHLVGRAGIDERSRVGGEES